MKTVHLNYADRAFMKSQQESTKSAHPYFTDCIQMGIADLDPVFRRENAVLLSNAHLAGYGCWKPQITRQVLDSLDDGDILFYTDSGTRFIADPTPLLDLTADQSVVGFALNAELTEGAWTKRDAMVAFDTEYMRETPQVCTSYIIWVKRPRTMRILSEWGATCVVPHLVDYSPSVVPNFPEFREHRCDQSLFSLIYKDAGLESYPDPSQWGNDNAARPYGQIFNHHRNRR